MTSRKSRVQKKQVSEDNPSTSEGDASTSTQTVKKTADETPAEEYDFRPKFTSERWRNGVFSMETMTLSHSLFINERDLLSEDQKRDRLAYTVFFKAQLEYERKENLIFKEDFEKMQNTLKAREKRIEEMQRSNQRDGSRDVDEGEARGSEADDSVFKKPLPVSTRKPEHQEKPKKGSGKKGSDSKDSSSSESGPKAKKGSGSKDSSGSESGTKSTRVKKSSSSSSEADTPGPKTRSSSRKKR